MSRSDVLSWFLAVVCLYSLPNPPTQPDPSEEIRAAIADRVAAYNSHNGKQLASFYQSDGDMLSLDGTLVEGRALIEKALTSAHDGEARTAHGEATVTKIRLIASDIALVDVAATATGLQNDKGKLGPISIRITYVLKKSNGRWENVAYRPMVVQQ